MAETFDWVFAEQTSQLAEQQALYRDYAASFLEPGGTTPPNPPEQTRFEEAAQK
jgi:hypothetical protein